MSKDATIGSNMLLITTFWGQDKTFKLMPVTKDCPYLEVLYDTNMQMLVALTVAQKENYEMLPKLDDDGELMKVKKPKANGRPFKEERRLMKVPQEFYMIERAEQEAFIQQFAINADTFDFKKYLDMKPKQQSEILQNPEAGQILGTDGKPMKAVK